MRPQFDWTEYERLLIARNAVRGQQVYNLALAIDPACPMRAAAVQLVRNVLQEAGTILVMRPDENTRAIPDVIEVALASHHRTRLGGAQEQDSDRGLQGSRRATDSRRTAVPRLPRRTAPVYAPSIAADPDVRPPDRLAERSRSSAASRNRRNRADSARAAQTVRQRRRSAPRSREERLPAATENVIRVEAERIDVVLDLVGELIIAKSMMQELLAEMNRSFANTSAARQNLRPARSSSRRFSRSCSAAVMKIRMVPVEQMFRRLPRVVRDTAKQTRPRSQHRHRGREHRPRQEHSGRPGRAHDAPAAQRRRSRHRAAAGARRRRQTA